MFIPGRKRRSDGIQCMCRKTLGEILKFDRHCNPFLNLFYGAHYAFSNQQEEQDTRPTHTTEKHNFRKCFKLMRIRPDTNMQEKEKKKNALRSKYIRCCSDHKI